MGYATCTCRPAAPRVLSGCHDSCSANELVANNDLAWFASHLAYSTHRYRPFTAPDQPPARIGARVLLEMRDNLRRDLPGCFWSLMCASRRASQ